MKKYLYISVLIGLLSSGNAFAQITLEHCQKMAKEHYPEVAQYDLISLSEQYSLTNAAAAWIPQITLSGQATYQNATPSFPESFSSLVGQLGANLSGIPKDQYKVAVDVSQVIWDGGATKANKALISAEALEQRLSSDVDLYALDERVNSLFFGILLLDENKNTAESRCEILASNYKKVESLKKNGAALQSDLDQISVEMLSLEQQIEQIDASRQSYISMLEAFTGESLSGKTLVKPQEGTLGEDTVRPELKLIDAKIASIDAKKGLLDASLYPKFSVFAQGYYGNLGYDYFKSMYSNSWSINAMVGVRMQWNISSFFTRANDLKRLDSAMNTANIQKDIFTFNTDLQKLQQNGEVTRIRKALQSDEKILDLRTNIRKAAESQRENGIIDTSTLIQKISEESVAKNNLSIHEIELLKSIYELRHSSGM